MAGRVRWWHWLPAIILIGGAYRATETALANWWAAGGPPVPQPEVFEHRGNVSCALAVLFLVLAVALVVINVRRLRRSTRPDHSSAPTAA